MMWYCGTMVQWHVGLQDVMALSNTVLSLLQWVPHSGCFRLVIPCKALFYYCPDLIHLILEIFVIKPPVWFIKHDSWPMGGQRHKCRPQQQNLLQSDMIFFSNLKKNVDKAKPAIQYFKTSKLKYFTLTHSNWALFSKLL